MFLRQEFSKNFKLKLTVLSKKAFNRSKKSFMLTVSLFIE